MLRHVLSSSKTISKLALINFVGASLMLSACAKKDDGAPAAAPGVPKTLAFSKPTPGEKLTRDQAQQIRIAFSNKPSMILPPGELIFVPKEMTPAMQARQEAELRSKDSNSYDLLKQIQANCVKSRPTVHAETTLPADGQDAKNSFKAGDYMSVNLTGGLSGTACAVDALGAIGYSARVDDRNTGDDTAKASGAFTSDIKAVMKDQRFAKLLGSRGLLVQNNLSGLVVMRQVSADKPVANMLIQTNLTGSYLSLEKDIPFSSTIQILSNENGGSESVMSFKINMTSFSFGLDIHTAQASVNAIPTQEMYLNGYPTTQAEINALFGSNSPAQVANTTA